MTQKEINDKIKESKAPQWFKNIEIDFNFSHLDISLPKKGFTSIYQFIARQKRGWERITDNLPSELQSSKNHFSSLMTAMDNFIINNIEVEEAYLPNQWRVIVGSVSQLNTINYFTYDSPITSFLINIHNKNTNYYVGALGYLFRNSNNFSNSDVLTGAFMAYEFKFQDSSSLPKRNRYERSSITQLRNSFEKQVTEVERNTTEISDELTKKVNKQGKEFNQYFIKKRGEINKWYKYRLAKEEEDNKYNLQRVKELENLYSEKLMLEKPADYWSTRAGELNVEAKSWLKKLMWCISISVVLLIGILALISTDKVAEIFSNTGAAIKWSITFITIISLLAFAIKTFAKLSFSAYHLARDAEERKQLVYVYLALKQNKAVGDNERILVLQSIFSRADSGLLKEDSSPTMPTSTSFMDKILNKS